MGQNEILSQDFPMQSDKSYDDEKDEKKQKLLRNEFKTVGKYSIPLIKKQNIDLSKIELWGFVKTKLGDDENKHKTIHFFTYDWLFESAYQKPEAAMEKLFYFYTLNLRPLVFGA